MSSSADTPPPADAAPPSNVGSNRICKLLHISQLKYDSIYMSVERAMIQRDLLGRSLKTKASKEQLLHITRDHVTIFEDVFSSVPEEGKLRAVALVAQRCNHNWRRRKQTEEANDNQLKKGRGRRPPKSVTIASTTRHGVNCEEFNRFAWVTVEADDLEQPALITSQQLLDPGRSLWAKGIKDLSFERFLGFITKELSFRPGVDELYCWVEKNKRTITSEYIWHGALEYLTRQGELEPGFIIGRHTNGTPPQSEPPLMIGNTQCTDTGEISVT